MTRRGRARRSPSPAPGGGPHADVRSRAGIPFETPLVALISTLVLWWRYRDALTMTFLNDDYLFLDATMKRGFWTLWGHQQLFFNWWRPWSRELHYWALQKLAGPSEPVFHAVNFLLIACAIGIFYGLAKSLLGSARAALATAAIASMAAWAPLVMWAAGAQDLWMMLWSLAALAAWRRGGRVLALACYALALMSKETAAPLPVLFVAWDVFVDRRAPGEALRRVLPAALIAVPWTLLHPQFGGRLFHHMVITPAAPQSRLPPLVALAHSMLALASADSVPAPLAGWIAPLLSAVPAVLLLTGIALAGSLLAQRAERPARGTVLFGLAWTACGWLPLLLPGLGWHAYYGLFGSFGAWLALGAIVRPGWVATGVIALFAILASAHDATPSLDWGDGYYVRRAGRMLGELRSQLVQQVPKPEHDTRMWFVDVPNNVGFLNSDGPSLRVWYRDPTLIGGFFSAWRPLPAGSRMRDRFFMLKPGPRWTELLAGPEDVTAALTHDAEWGEDHMSLGRTFVDAGAWDVAAREFEKVARALPRDAEPAYNVAACRMALGDSLGMRTWLAEALRRPVVTDRLRAAARASGLNYW